MGKCDKDKIGVFLHRGTDCYAEVLKRCNTIGLVYLFLKFKKRDAKSAFGVEDRVGTGCKEGNN